MKKLLLCLFIFFGNNIFSQTTDWVKSFGGSKSDKGISIGVDSLGFIYISGFFNNNADFGSFNLVYNGGQNNNKDMFVAKLDSFGTVIWAISGGGGPYDDRALGMHVTPGGDIFLTGTFWSSIEFPYNTPGAVSNPTSNGADNSMLTKIDKDGNCEFVISIIDDNNTSSPSCGGGIYSSDDHSYDVKVDDDGFIYVTGFFSGDEAEFIGGFTLNNPNWVNCQPQGYIGKLDPSGNWLWVDNFDGIKDQRGSRDNRLEIDQFSNIYVVGGFQGTGTYGPFSITSNGEWDAFIFKMDKDGNWLWAEGFGSNKADRANGIAIDVCDDIYITGEYRNPMVFPGANASNGTDTLSHKQKRDVFVAKMNNQGEWKWAKRARSEGTDKPYQMSVDANKQVFVGGTARGEMTFSNGLVVGPQIPGDTTASAWVAQIDGTSNNGDWVWAKMGGCATDDDDRTGDICPDGFGNVYAIGFYEDAANFDGTILNALGRKDIFVWKMSMIPGSFTHNNTFDTIYAADIMVFNPADTGVFTTSFLMIDGCDTAFVDSVVHQKLGVQINFNINNAGTATFAINGVIQAMPYSQNYWAGETINIEAILQANWLFSQWMSYANNVSPTITSVIASFVANVSDSCVLYTHPQPPLSAFISGNDSVCLNASYDAQVSIAFNGAVSPYTLVYAIDGISQTPITTTLNPYIINTKQEGVYTLLSFNDAIAIGWVSGSALVTVRQSPTANFEPQPDSMTIIYTTTQFIDKSVVDASVNIVSWNWNFGDNTSDDSARNPYHTYKDSVGIYQISLIVMDNLGCSDTTYKQLWVLDDYWMYIPNSFTPDLDGINDIFCIQYHGVRKETFYFNVYDRFSTLVYTTSNITDLECELNSNAWDGTHYLSKKELPLGSYIYEMYFQDFEGWKHQESGHIIIVR
jgi:gliding motility-associated-like protein